MTRAMVLAALLPAVVAAKELRYFNVVPIQGGNVEFAAQEVKRQRVLGVKAIAVSLSYHPQCTPAANLLPIHAANFRRLKELLKDTDVEIGVLIQSTAGHGWNGKVQLSKEPWQHAVYADGKTNPRWCQLDPGFRAYVLEAFRSISREKPSFLLIDDDFGPKHREGFCPLHVARYNAAAGVNKTADEWRRLANDGDQQDPLRRQMEESRRRVPIEFAKEIRAAIDSVDPTIRCGMCTPAAGAGFTKEVALALAGPATRPFVRIFNAVYGRQHPTCFLSQLQHLRQLEGMMDGVGELVAEADTWPQNHWSEPARYFAAHLIFDVLYGLDGAKLWMSEFERPRDVGSQARFEKVFSDELPKRQALYDLMRTQHPKFHGVTGVVNWGRDVCDSTRGGDWDHGTPLRTVFESFGFPCEITKTSVRDPRNVWALTRNSVRVMTDDEIRAVLAHRAYVDAIAAKDLTRRGFANLLGVEATDGDENFYYNIEIPADGSDALKMMSDASSAFLKPVSDKVETLSRFAYRDPFMAKPDLKSPGLTYFRNELGGEVAVAGWTFENAGFNYMPWAKYTKVARKEQLVKVMDRLSGGLMPFVACENNHAISTWATLDDGSTLFTMTNLSIDDWRDLRVRLDAVPVSAELLADDGTWRPVVAEKTGEHEVTFRVGEVRCLKPQILLLRDQGSGIGDQGAGMDRVTWENLDRFAATNVRLVKGPVKGIAVDHHGLGCRFFRPEKPEEFGREWAARGVVFVHPHTNPWCWMNDQAIGLTDEIVDVIIDHYKLPKDVKVLSAGGSMGGLGALVWARYTKHRVVACAVNCPVCDLEYHTTERPDVIRSVKSAFGTEPDFTAAVRRHSPLRIAAELPDIPYFFVHADGDTAVNKGAHSDKLVPLLRSLGRKVEYVTSVGKNHCELTDESRAAWEKARFAPFEKEGK